MADVVIDTREVHRLAIELDGLGRGAPAAVAAALNRSLTHVKKEMRLEAVKKYEVASKDVQKTLNATKATKNNLQAKVISKGQTLSLMRFKVKPNRRPQQRGVRVSSRPKVQVKIKKDSGYKVVGGTPGAFIQTMNSANNIWRRVGRGRTDVKVLRSLSVPQMIGNEEVIERIKRSGQEMLDRRLTHEINYRMSRIGRGGT